MSAAVSNQLSIKIDAWLPAFEILPDGLFQSNFAACALLEIDQLECEHDYSPFTPGDFKTFDAFWLAVDCGSLKFTVDRRQTQAGRIVWLQSSFEAIRDVGGRMTSIVQHLCDVTEHKAGQHDLEGQIGAINRSLCVITFNVDGTVVSANRPYLEAMGYTLDEIEGRHHRMFVDPSFAHGAEYARFWRELDKGQFQHGEYLRYAKGGRPVWFQATYNPIFSLDGHPTKIIKYATVVTEERLRQAEHQGQIAAIHKAQAVISFELDGTIIDANDNFLEFMGYRLSEVRGRHHRMFVDPEVAESEQYAAF